jgi:hypothetical protein
MNVTSYYRIVRLIVNKKVAEKAPARRLLKNAQIQGARNPEE